jgi:hypothetical protein
MKLTKSDWYLILLALVIFTLIATNELGIGVITFLPLTLLAYWLMIKTFETHESGK